jgi:hypothetical protein
MDEVGCPDPAPELERMLSILSCWASECHCSTPAVSWLICCVTAYLLGRESHTGRYYSYYPAWANRKRVPWNVSRMQTALSWLC